MTEYRADVRITPREGLLDPEGKAIEKALHSLEFAEAEAVRVGRLVRLHVSADTAEAAAERVDAMCKELLANPVTEEYEISIIAGA